MEKLTSVADLFKKSWEIYTRKFWSFIKLLIVNMLVILPVFALFFSDFLLKENKKASIFLVIMSALFVLSASIISIIVQVSLIVVIKEREKNLSLKQYLFNGLDYTAPYIWTGVLMLLAILAGLILLVIPAVIFAVWFSLATYLVVSEGQKGKQALKSSKELVKGYWWPVFGRFLLIIMLGMAVSWLPFIGSFFNSFFFVPFSLVYGYLIYEDLRRVKSSVLPMQVAQGAQ